MQANRQLSFITLGLALFAMFFGSGNLIFPLFLGQLAEEQWSLAAIGFSLTAVIVPLLGVFAMVIFKGNYAAFFDCLGKKGGLFAIFLLLSVWIPLGSGPRCAMLAYSSLLPYLESPFPLWSFSLVYCVLCYLLVYKKGRMLDVLGRILTPLLLLCLALIVVWGLDASALQTRWDWSVEARQLFVRSLKEGYNTMDLIASFFFSASIIDILRRSTHDESQSLKKTLQGSLVCTALLAIVYVGLICLAASHAETLQGVPKELQLVVLAKNVMGSQLGLVASLAIFLACLTTSVALAGVFADFLADKLFGSQEYYPLALGITQVFTFGMSITGLEGISFVTEPILQVSYPILIGLIVYNVSVHVYRKYQTQKGVDLVSTLD